MEAEPSWLVRRKLTENQELLILYNHALIQNTILTYNLI